MNMSETMVDAKKTRCRWSATALQDVSSYLRQRHLVNLTDVQSARFVHDCLESSDLSSSGKRPQHFQTRQSNAMWRGCFFLAHFLADRSTQHRRRKVSLLHFFETSTSTVIAALVNGQVDSSRQEVSTQQLKCNGSRRH